MKDEDVTKRPDGTIECVMVIGDNPCVVQVVPTQNTDLTSIRNMIEKPVGEPKNFYMTRNDFYRLCREIDGKEEFKGITIINPKKKSLIK